jgi:choice-of-anchor B domain-containing protein
MGPRESSGVMQHSARSVLILVLLLATALPAAAHPDDPKVLDRVPPYPGSGYLRGSGPVTRALDHDFPVENMTLWAWYTLPDISPELSSGNDCWGYVSPSGREYALMGTSHGTAFFEVTDPGASALLAHLPGPESIWRDIKVYKDHAYAVSEAGEGIQVFDLGDIDAGNVTLVNTITTGGNLASHNLAINEDSGYLYRLGGGANGLRIYSLADPSNPVWVSNWTDRYVHDAVIVTFTHGRFAGREIAFLCSGFNGGRVETGLEILDVTDKQDIRQISRLVYPEGAYSHQGWISEDHRYFYLNDELDEQNQGIPTRTRVFSVSDLHQPALVGSFSSGTNSIDHNLYVHEGRIYEANYRSGLRIFDASDPENPVQEAWFDTWPDDDNNRFNGLWSVYPFLPSGTIIGSDIERGLFVLTIGDPPVGGSQPGLPAPGPIAGLDRRGEFDVVSRGPIAPPPSGGRLQPEDPRLETPIVINEVAWMGTSDSRSSRWVELLNRSAAPVALAGWSLGGLDGAPGRPLSGTLGPGELLVLAEASTESTPCLVADGELPEGLLDGATAGLVLRDASGMPVEVLSAWHAGRSRGAATMARIDPRFAVDDPVNWWTSTASYCGGSLGSPGRPNQVVRRPGESLAPSLTAGSKGRTATDELIPSTGRR